MRPTHFAHLIDDVIRTTQRFEEIDAKEMALRPRPAHRPSRAMTRMYLVRDEPIDYTRAFDAGRELEDECLDMSATEFYSVFAEVASPGRMDSAEIIAESRRLVVAAESLHDRARSALAAQESNLALLNMNTRQAVVWAQMARTAIRRGATSANQVGSRPNN